MPISKPTWNSELKRFIEQNWRVGQIFKLAGEVEARFQFLHPRNINIQKKLLQTMQNLRNEGFIEFVDDRETYRRIAK